MDSSSSGSGSGPGSGSGSGYLNPQRVYELVIRRMPRELLAYLDLIPGASQQDLNYHRLKLVGRALLTLASQPRLSPAEEEMRIQCWAQLALFHAKNSRFCAPQIVGDPSSFTSDAGQYMHPQNSSSYSGRMLTHKSDSIDLGHAAVHNQLSASNSRIQAATVPPLRASSSDVISFPTRRARMLDETSAFNLGSHALAYAPSRDLGHAAVHNQLSSSNSRIQAATVPPLRASSSDVISFPTRRARMLDETSAFNLGSHALANVPSRGNSTLGHFMHPHSSSSYSSRMLNHEPDSNELIQSAASSSRTPAATLFPLEENFDDVHRHAAMHNQLSVSSSSIHTAMLPQLQANTMINFPARRAGMGDETSASNSGTHASAYVPLRDKSMLAQEFAELSLGRPGSEQFTPLQMMLMQNTEVDIKGKRPAPEVDQIKAKILTLNVASVITRVGLKSAAGVLIRDGSTSQFMTASCFRPMMYMDPALLFAAACCEGIKNALFYGPTTVVLESHQVPLLEQLVASRAAEAVQLNQFVGSHPPCYRIWTISEESNGAACQLVRHALQMEESKKVLKDPPDWLVPYLDQRG